jgi:hypothetical protein
LPVIGDGAEHHSAAETIDEAAVANRPGGADESGPEVQLRVSDAADVEIGQEQPVMGPSPCVRPGRVPTIAAAAMISTTQP